MKSWLENKDLDLFKRVKSGDREAFAIFFRKYKQKVFNICYSHLYNYEYSMDAADETFTKFYKNIKRIEDIKKIDCYLYKIAHNLCTDWVKKYRREIPLSQITDEDNQNKIVDDPVKPTEQTPEAILIEAQDRITQEQLCKLVNEKMKELKCHHRTAIYLMHYEGLTYEEASEILECPVGTVKSRVNRGILELGKLIKEQYQMN